MLFFNILKKQKNVIHGISEKQDGSMNVFSDFGAVGNILKATRKAGFKKVSIENIALVEQIHSTNVFDCPAGMSGFIKLQSDGLVSKNTGQVLMVKTADCVPLLIYSKKEKKVGALHAGFLGIAKGIIEHGISKFKNPRDLIVAIGPHIRSCCYYLRGESQKYAKKPYYKKYIEKRDDKLYFDLTEITIDKLIKLGVKKENIEDCKICTFCQSQRFFSLRASEKLSTAKGDKRFGSFIGLR